MRADCSRRIEVRALEPRDFEVVRALQRRAVPGFVPWSAAQLRAQFEAFPQGQLVAVRRGEVVGLSSSLIVKWDDWVMHHTFEAVTGAGSFSTHDAAGRTLYGAMMLIDPQAYNATIANALHLARRRVCAAMRLRRVIAPSRLPGYHAVHGVLDPEHYAMRVLWGDVEDRDLSAHIERGFVYCGVIRDYLPQDAASCGHAAVVAWTNPRYRAHPPLRGRPRRHAEAQALAPSPPAMAVQ
jgi:hypothetical protein